MMKNISKLMTNTHTYAHPNQTAKKERQKENIRKQPEGVKKTHYMKRN